MIRLRITGARRRTPPRQRAPGLKDYWIRGFIGTALVLLLASLLAVAFSARQDESQRRRQLAAGAEILARSVGAGLAQIRRPLEALRTDPALQAAFSAQDPERLRDQETRLGSLIAGALGVQLSVPERMDAAEETSAMGYAGLDLARQAAQKQSVTQLEVHRVGQGDMHLAIAAPVLDPEGVRTLGVVHLTLPMSLLPDPAGILGDLGTALYQQVVGKELATLRGTAPSRDPDHAAAIPGTRLRVAAWLGPADWADAGLVTQVALADLVVLALLGALLWWGYWTLRRDLTRDCEALAAALADRAQGRPAKPFEPRLREVRDIYTALTGTAGGAAAGGGPEVGADAASPPYGLGGGDEVAVEELELPQSGDTARDQGGGGSATPGPGPTATFESLGSLYAEPAAGPEPAVEVSGVFGAYDIRGVVDLELGAETMLDIGRALGSEAAARGEETVVIGRDLRDSSPRLAAALAEGVRAAGVDVVDLGVVPTPLVYFACCHPQRRSGAMVTASHNPPEYNGVKPVLSGEGADAGAIQGLRRRIEQGQLAQGSGGYRREDLGAQYRGYIAQDLTLARHLKLVVDCGNATTSSLAPQLFRDLGCEVVELNCDSAAGMGDRMPDPSVPQQLQGLGDLVRRCGADVGLAFDGDGDRLGLADSEGRFVAADRVLMLFAADVLARHPGSDVVFDVKCSRHLAEEIRRAGGRPLMWRSGHTPLKAKLRETGAPIAGELSGHFIFKERWFGFDDALYAGARLLELLSLDPRPSHEVFAALPGGIATPELSLPLAAGEARRVMESVLAQASALPAGHPILIDGLRVELDKAWGLVRASNTEPRLSFRFEGDDPQSLEQIQALFRRIMGKAAPALKDLPF